MTRRQFVSTAASTFAFTIVPGYVLGANGKTPPSEKLNIASIGAGGMAKGNIKNCRNENIVALCDVDDERAAEMYGIYPKAKKYKDFRKMLEKQKDIDAVIVCTPDHTHAVAAAMAMEMGKHVYVQKPLTHNIAEARKLLEISRRKKVVTQMGNQGHSREGIRLAVEWIKAGVIGDVREVHCWTDRAGDRWPQGVDKPEESPPVPPTLDWDLWLGPAPKRAYHPDYHPFRWRGWFDFGTGALGDMGCHIIDTPYWALHLGYPEAVYASSTAPNDQTYPLASIVHYEFGARGDMPPVKLTWYDGGLLPPRPNKFEPERKLGKNGILFIGDQGAMIAGSHGAPPRLIPETQMDRVRQNKPPKYLPRVDGSHEQNWIDACKGKTKACADFEYSVPMTEVVLLGCIATRLQERKLFWDSKAMKFSNDETANELLQRQYRQGWTL